ncbi:MAG: Flp pilus assembly protein CpaB [Archangium sp.]|nr:Flp pilus assembly protein CpaB [Archangium sp.]MDP3574232.1 Flp pilus assembly protein CpaB [Archangium sp.]
MIRSLSVAALLSAFACGAPDGPTVLTAARDLSAGTVLTPELLSAAHVTHLSEAGPGAVSSDALHSILGGAVRVPLSKGDFIQLGALTPPGVPFDLGASTPSGLRAVSIVATGADLVKRGDHVDLLNSLQDPVTGQEVVVRLLQNVVVLAVGPDDRQPTAAFPLRQVTFQVLPEEAELLAQAEDTGLIQVVLRNPDDLELLVDQGRSTLDTVLSGERPRVLQQKRFKTIQVIRGSGGGGSPPVEEVYAAPLMDRAVESPRLGKIVFRDETGQFKPLPIRALRTFVYVEGPRARTVVDYVVENPFDRELEGSLRYPLPQDASPAFFGTFQGALPFDVEKLAKSGGVLPPLGNDVVVTANLTAITPATSPGIDWKAFRPARVVGKQQAAKTYETITRRRVDPALLEWAGGNDFEARVYPIAAKSLKRVVLVYEQTLSSDGHFLHYAFPLPATAIPTFEVRLLVDDSKSTPAALTVGGEDRLAAFTTRVSGFSVAALMLDRKPFAQDLRLAMKPLAPAAQLLVGGGDAELPGHFVYGRLVAEFPQTTASAPTGDALFIVDTSLSEAGDRARLVGQVLQQVLEKDDTIKRFNVLLFDIRSRWLFPAGMRENAPAARQETIGALNTIFREGATSFESALGLLESTAWLPAGATAFLLSDGKLTWGETNPRLLLKRSPRAQSLKWIAFRFGDAAINRTLFEALTDRGGQVVTCFSGSQVATAALAHRNPQLRIESIRVDGVRVHDFVVRGAPQALVPGQVIEVAGRVLGGQGPSGEIVAQGSLDGVPVTLRWPFKTEGQDMLAGRAWAELHTERLLALESSRLDTLILALSQHFGMTNRLASLLVLETDAEYVQYALKKVQVSMSELEALAKTSLTRGEDVPAGLERTALGQPALDFLAQLPKGGRVDPLANLKLEPSAGGEARAQAEAAYLAARKKSPEDLLVFHAIGQARFQAGDALGAARAISSVVELRPEDPEALRMTGFVLLSQGLAQPAAEIFGHLRATRSFEVQAYLEEALALVEAGRTADAALNYELVLARTWDRHSQVVEAGRQAYVQWLRRLLGGSTLNDAQRKAVTGRLAVLAQGVPVPLDLQVTLHWNADDIDIDLWVTGPEGVRTWYQERDTRSGGKLFWDETRGYGPELFHQRSAHTGSYRTQVHYYSNNSEQWAIPSVVLGVLDRYPNDPKRFKRQFKAALLKSQAESEAELFKTNF